MRGRSTVMFATCSPCLRKGARPDDADLLRMEGTAPEPRQNARPLAARSLTGRAATLELACEPFTTGHH